MKKGWGKLLKMEWREECGKVWNRSGRQNQKTESEKGIGKENWKRESEKGIKKGNRNRESEKGIEKGDQKRKLEKGIESVWKKQVLSVTLHHSAVTTNYLT